MKKLLLVLFLMLPTAALAVSSNDALNPNPAKSISYTIPSGQSVTFSTRGWSWIEVQSTQQMTIYYNGIATPWLSFDDIISPVPNITYETVTNNNGSTMTIYVRGR